MSPAASIASIASWRLFLPKKKKFPAPKVHANFTGKSNQSRIPDEDLRSEKKSNAQYASHSVRVCKLFFPSAMNNGYLGYKTLPNSLRYENEEQLAFFLWVRDQENFKRGFFFSLNSLEAKNHNGQMDSPSCVCFSLTCTPAVSHFFVLWNGTDQWGEDRTSHAPAFVSWRASSHLNDVNAVFWRWLTAEVWILSAETGE